MTTTGLFQIDLCRIGEVVPAKAQLATDPLGQVVAVISAYLPEGSGSELYDWQETAYLRADRARQKIDIASFATLASWAPDLEIASPDADVREHWRRDRTFVEGVPDEDWAGAGDDE